MTANEVIHDIFQTIFTPFEHECEGVCSRDGECRGEVEKVTVLWNNKPIDFWYCQTAIEEDRERGFEVTIKEEE